MRVKKGRRLLLLWALMLWLWLPAALADVDEITAVLPVSAGTVEIRAAFIDEELWLFLPAHAGWDALMLQTPEGQADMAALCQEDDGTFTLPLPSGETLHLMRSETVRALYLFSADPENEGRLWLEGGEKHERSTTGRMMLVAADGAVAHADQLRQLRGRGNWTWTFDKKPYQFKLENRADLLGDSPNEANRTWVLLASMTDTTFLHDRIALDLGLEMGLSETPRSEPVDLYYDGEYRGCYLLCEKVEVGEGRIEIRDYDDLLEGWNRRVGQFDLEALPVAETADRFGNLVRYVDGVIAAQDVGAGGYLIEMESELTLSDRCWFELDDGVRYAFKSPENPDRAMAVYVSELLQEGMHAIRNGGTNPDTGKTIAEYFDLDSYAALALVHEFSGNLDAFIYSSTHFILPEGETRFRAGPVWDSDLAFRYRMDGGMGLTNRQGLLVQLYQCEAFQQALTKRLPAFEHAVQNVLLGGESGARLRSFDAYNAEVAASRQMDDKLWDAAQSIHLVYGSDTHSDVLLMRQYLAERLHWLGGFVRSLGQADTFAMTLDAVYLNAEDTLRLAPSYPWLEAEIVGMQSEQLTEADEENYALWQTYVLLKGGPSEGMTLTVNGTEVAFDRLEDGTALFAFQWEDRSYKPVDYWGEDIGLVYDPDFYAALYPEVAAECGDDPEALMDWFYLDGMTQGQQGNAMFSPRELRQWLSEPALLYGTDWSMYYSEAMMGMAQEWMAELGKRFQPTVVE